jgi:hypothetical protein
VVASYVSRSGQTVCGQEGIGLIKPTALISTWTSTGSRHAMALPSDWTPIEECIRINMISGTSSSVATDRSWSSVRGKRRQGAAR